MKYDKPDEYFTLNNDPALEPIKIYIDKIIRQVYKSYNTPYYVPDFKKIDGYGLKPEKQIFNLPQYPERLKSLEHRMQSKLEKELGSGEVSPQRFLVEIKRELSNKKKEYVQEINFIKSQWYCRLYGYWCYINGKPTYIAPSHYSYLTTWDMGDVGLPKYRDRDRRRALFETYLYTTTDTFKNMEQVTHGLWKAIPNDDGDYEMTDSGSRTFLGSVYPKPRRDGATHFSLSFGYDLISTITGASSLMGILSFDAVSAKGYYRNLLLPAFKKKPFYFKPMWGGNGYPLGTLEFVLPQTITGEPELESKIDPANQANRRYYDNKKCYYIHCDEEGKSYELKDLIAQWNILIPTLTLGGGSKIHGYSMHPSTVEEMDSGGGQLYLDLCTLSNYYIRNKITGQTQSGLAVYFIPSSDGLEGYIGKYGESIIGDPTPEQADFIGKNHGAKEYIRTKREELLSDKTPNGTENYRSFVRKFPEQFSDCFIGNTGDIGFNILKLDRAIARINNTQEKLTRLGNFYLQGNIDSGTVVFREEPSGRWEVSKLMREGMENKRIRKMVWNNLESANTSVWCPEGSRFVASADAYKFDDKNEKQLRKHKKDMSDGGGAIFELRNKEEDGDDKPQNEWNSYNFVATYQARTPERDQYCMDMLLACIYYGAMMYPEMNVEIIWEYFLKKGFGGYMLYGNDSEGKRKPKPGFYTKDKQNLFNSIRDWIETRAFKCNHKTLLEDMKNIKSMEDMTNYDRFTAAGGCLLASTTLSVQYMEKRDKKGFGINQFLRRYS